MTMNDWLTPGTIAFAVNEKKGQKSHSNRLILQSFLKVLDSMDHLLEAFDGQRSDQDEKMPHWSVHLEAVRDQMLEVFADAGVKFYDSVGECFDPGRHEAIDTVFQPDINKPIVLKEISRGCEWMGQVLRFSQVIVARPPEKERKR